jgi:hypothetical protein
MAAAELIGLVTAVVLMVAAFVSLNKKVTEIHVLVNAKMTNALDRIEQLSAVLVQAGLLVPQERGEEANDATR